VLPHKRQEGRRFILKLTKITRKGSSPWNEDAFVENSSLGVYGVIDGATSLAAFTGKNGETGGYLASRIIAECLVSMRSTSGDDFSLYEALLEANRQLRVEMIKHGIHMDRKEELWGACVVLIRVMEDYVEFAQAGDCMLTAVYSDGLIRTITRDQLEHLDSVTRSLWAKGVSEGLIMRDELWSYVKQQIVSGRQSANTDSGYGVLNGDPELSRFMEFGRINRINLKALLLMSDGLYMPKTDGQPSSDAEEVTRSVISMGLENYINQLMDIEESDPDCLNYPRVKKSDDKTALWIEF
jgi:serine/threonine protein phosphatase PrpC